MKTAMIAMSGGVDSSVAAFIIKEQGYNCIGATMKLYEAEDAGGEKTCCTASDAEDARSVANRLGIPFYVFDYRKDFYQLVIAPFVESYEKGETPNPCIECNRHLKFSKLYDKAKTLGADYIVTGHYAKIVFDQTKGRYLLKKAKDPAKDQSYVLYSLTQEQLAHTLFPLGELDKQQTRQIATDNHFINAKKHESQDICFVPDGDYAAFIEQTSQKTYPCGDFVDQEGNVLGEHKGIIRYTVGQRKGLGLALPAPMYVCKKDVEHNQIILCYKENLKTKEVFADRLNWIAMESLKEPMRVYARLRYNQKEQPATVYPLENGRVKVIFDEALNLPAAPGQALVMYDGDIVVGGGTIIN